MKNKNLILLIVGAAAVVLIVLAFILVGCDQLTEEDLPDVLYIVSRSPSLEAADVSPTATLSITANFPVDTTGVTKDNLRDQ